MLQRNVVGNGEKFAKNSKARHSEALCVPRNPSLFLQSNRERFLTCSVHRERNDNQKIKPYRRFTIAQVSSKILRVIAGMLVSE